LDENSCNPSGSTFRNPAPLRRRRLNQKGDFNEVQIYRGLWSKERKKSAREALAEIRALAAAKYPVAMLFDKFCPPGLERKAGEGWATAYGRHLGFGLPELRDFAKGTIESSYYRSNSDTPPTNNDLINFYRGWSALLIITERELEQAKAS
jgi:hypothetical protein